MIETAADALVLVLFLIVLFFMAIAIGSWAIDKCGKALRGWMG